MRAAISAYKSTIILFSAGLLALDCIGALAQQTTGVPGSPDAQRVSMVGNFPRPTRSSAA
jgi:hypothetical protein